jgi:mitogen-activated protein kinase 1/3
MIPDIKESSSIPKINTDPSAGWDIEPNYAFSEIIGYGSYGTVCSAFSQTRKTLVAIKKYINIFSDSFRCKRILREVELLFAINHPCIIEPLDVFMKQGADLYLVMELGQTDLFNLRNSIFLVDDQVKAIMYELILALNYIHSGGIINRDVKPANILINSDCSIKLCDFSLGRCFALPNHKGVRTEYNTDKDTSDEMDEGYKSTPQIVYCKFEVNFHKAKPCKVPLIGPKAISETTLVFLKPKDKKYSFMPMQKEYTKDPQLSGYVATRWYRPPEVILQDKAYTTVVDIWGAGCVFAELLEMIKENLTSIGKRSALFPGESCFPLSPAVVYDVDVAIPSTPQDQLKKILQFIGELTPSDLSFLKDKSKEQYVKSLLGNGTKVDFKEKFPATSDQAIDLLKRMLEFNPSKRISARGALEHRYFEEIRDISLEKVITTPVTLLTDTLKDVSSQILASKVLEKVYSKLLLN